MAKAGEEFFDDSATVAVFPVLLDFHPWLAANVIIVCVQAQPESYVEVLEHTVPDMLENPR